ncbi:MAG: peptide deformylase [Phycisphaeraceae bacterium]
MREVHPDKLAIVLYPDPVLRETCQPVQQIDEQVQAVARRMLELMHHAHGVGLAAPQVSLNWRLFVANPSGEPDDNRVFINPTLVSLSRETATQEEGCLSIPHVTAEITRPTGVTIRALDLQGQPFQLTSDELPARVWQHEYDHLDGVLITDRMTRVDRMANKRALRELEAAHVKS